jgi:hypothetical protein
MPSDPKLVKTIALLVAVVCGATALGAIKSAIKATPPGLI